MTQAVLNYFNLYYRVGQLESLEYSELPAGLKDMCMGIAKDFKDYLDELRPLILKEVTEVKIASDLPFQNIPKDKYNLPTEPGNQNGDPIVIKPGRKPRLTEEEKAEKKRTYQRDWARRNYARLHPDAISKPRIKDPVEKYVKRLGGTMPEPAAEEPTEHIDPPTAHEIAKQEATSDDDKIFCQYTQCPERGKKFDLFEMHRLEEFGKTLFFHSRECLEYYKDFEAAPI